MEIKKFGREDGKSIMLLHGNLMCWRQFEDIIPLLSGIRAWRYHQPPGIFNR